LERRNDYAAKDCEKAAFAVTDGGNVRICNWMRDDGVDFRVGRRGGSDGVISGNVIDLGGVGSGLYRGDAESRE
jgi:hypothetical protein